VTPYLSKDHKIRDGGVRGKSYGWGRSKSVQGGCRRGDLQVRMQTYPPPLQRTHLTGQGKSHLTNILLRTLKVACNHIALIELVQLQLKPTRIHAHSSVLPNPEIATSLPFPEQPPGIPPSCQNTEVSTSLPLPEQFSGYTA